MRRTQLYLEDDLWSLLHLIAKQTDATVSDLVRQAIREKYAQNLSQRREAMEAVIGLWSDRADIGDSSAYVRKLRRDNRLERMTP